MVDHLIERNIYSSAKKKKEIGWEFAKQRILSGQFFSHFQVPFIYIRFVPGTNIYHTVDISNL